MAALADAQTDIDCKYRELQVCYSKVLTDYTNRTNILFRYIEKFGPLVEKPGDQDLMEDYELNRRVLELEIASLKLEKQQLELQIAAIEKEKLEKKVESNSTDSFASLSTEESEEDSDEKDSDEENSEEDSDEEETDEDETDSCFDSTQDEEESENDSDSDSDSDSSDDSEDTKSGEYSINEPSDDSSEYMWESNCDDWEDFMKKEDVLEIAVKMSDSEEDARRAAQLESKLHKTEEENAKLRKVIEALQIANETKNSQILQGTFSLSEEKLAQDIITSLNARIAELEAEIKEANALTQEAVSALSLVIEESTKAKEEESYQMVADPEESIASLPSTDWSGDEDNLKEEEEDQLSVEAQFPISPEEMTRDYLEEMGMKMKIQSAPETTAQVEEAVQAAESLPREEMALALPPISSETVTQSTEIVQNPANDLLEYCRENLAFLMLVFLTFHSAFLIFKLF